MAFRVILNLPIIQPGGMGCQCSWKYKLQGKESEYPHTKRAAASETTHLFTVWPTQMTTVDYCVGKTNVKNVNIRWVYMLHATSKTLVRPEVNIYSILPLFRTLLAEKGTVRNRKYIQFNVAL